MLFGVPAIEFILFVVGLVLIAGMAGLAMFLFFGLPAVLDRVGYSVKVPGWGMRLAEPPPFNSTVDDVGRMNSLLLKHAVDKGYSQREVKRVLNASRVRWVRADPSLGGRAVVDPWNRRVPVLDDAGNETGETKPMRVAGWHRGNTLYVVFVEDDVIERTAYAHEGGHGIHLLKGVVDYEHKDASMFGKEGIVSLAKVEMHKERTGKDPVEPLDDGTEVKEV